MGDYEQCLKYLKSKKVKLYDYQKEMLKALIEGKEVRTARGVGRSYVVNCYADYIAHILDKNDYSKEPDICFPYTVALEDGLLTERIVRNLKSLMSIKDFNREFLCKEES